MAMASDDSIRRCRLGEDNVDDCKRESKADGKADYMSGKKPARAGGATKRSAAVRSLQLPDFNREGFDYCTCCSKGVDWCRRGRSARITSNHLLSTGCGEKLLPAHGDCIRGKATTFAGERRRILAPRSGQSRHFIRWLCLRSGPLNARAHKSKERCQQPFDRSFSWHAVRP
jgi:hypothetical protein